MADEFKLEMTKTHRGFALIEFRDRYDLPCSLQKSSIATEDCIWLGVSEVTPKIMASDAIKLGIPTGGQTTGWIDVVLPEEVSLSSRMHLTQEMAAALIPVLQKFVETGEL